MSGLRRILHIFIAALMIFGAYIMVASNEGYAIIVLILGLTFMVRGFAKIFFYISMARFAVGGKSILISGIFFLDIGAFTITLSNIPKSFIMFYLLGVYFISGGILLLRGLERKKVGAGWKFHLIRGLINIGLASTCFFTYTNFPVIVVWLFAASIVYSAIMRIINALRKTAIIYVQ